MKVEAPKRSAMAIKWLRPLKGLVYVDYEELCVRASRPEMGKPQGYGSRMLHERSRQMAYAAKLRWLEVRANPSAFTMVQFERIDVDAIASKTTIQHFANQGSEDFITK